ncbi:MAG: hypothetical protein V1816_26255 [Pseudomonadota bacterium]
MKSLAAVVLVCLALALGCGGGSSSNKSNPYNPNVNWLPLLGPGTWLGVVKPEGHVGAPKALIEAAFNECLRSGVKAYQYSIAWSELEKVPGVIDASRLDLDLAVLQTHNLAIYLNIPTINRNRLALPYDLVDPQNPDRLAPGLKFDSREVLDRFGRVLDRVVPILVARGGFFLSIGQEIDVYLAANSGAVNDFINFTGVARNRVKGLDSRLGVGVNFGFRALEVMPSTIPKFLSHGDAASFNYYPLYVDYRARPPEDVDGDLDRLLNSSQGLPLLLQEAGYTSGYHPTPTNGSSQEWQRRFMMNLIRGVKKRPRIRFCSVIQLADWTDETVDRLMLYYGASAPLFREYLAGLGLLFKDGSPKTSYETFLVEAAQLDSAGD